MDYAAITPDTIRRVIHSFERCCETVLQCGRTFAYSRKAELTKHRDFTVWRNLAIYFVTNGYDPREYFEVTLRAWKRWNKRPDQRRPFAKQIAGRPYKERWLEHLASRTRAMGHGLDVGTDLWHWRGELRDGARIVRGALEVCQTEQAALGFCWPACPPIYLVFSEAFWQAIHAGAIDVEVNRPLYDAVVELHGRLSDPAMAEVCRELRASGGENDG